MHRDKEIKENRLVFNKLFKMVRNLLKAKYLYVIYT